MRPRVPKQTTTQREKSCCTASTTTYMTSPARNRQEPSNKQNLSYQAGPSHDFPPSRYDTTPWPVSPYVEKCKTVVVTWVTRPLRGYQPVPIAYPWSIQGEGFR